MPKTVNLNDLKPLGEDWQAVNSGSTFNRDNSVRSGSTQVYFRDLVPRLIEHISQADTVLGCVAWLTHAEILEALATKSCAIVVQKEDFLRPDMDAGADWKARLREKYSRIECESTRYAFRNVIGELSYGGDPTIDGVRCVGNFNRDKSPAFPRMHNKFLVFCRNDDEPKAEEPRLVPYGVWTGSFNLTFNAQNSLENAVYLSDEQIVSAYFNEFAQIMAISERLDWESDWSAPEWRIGS